jgi:hypothetical protein
MGRAVGARCLHMGRAIHGASYTWAKLSMGPAVQERDVIGQVVIGQYFMGRVVMGQVAMGRVSRESS